MFGNINGKRFPTQFTELPVRWNKKCHHNHCLIKSKSFQRDVYNFSRPLSLLHLIFLRVRMMFCGVIKGKLAICFLTTPDGCDSPLVNIFIKLEFRAQMLCQAMLSGMGLHHASFKVLKTFLLFCGLFFLLFFETTI